MESSKNLHSVWLIMKYVFGIVPIVAGLDKFTNLLVDWKKYLPTFVPGVLHISAATFMMVVGVIEIIAGIVVLTKPKIGAYVVSAWLVLIAINLIITGYYDIAVRDLVIATSAFSFGQLTA